MATGTGSKAQGALTNPIDPTALVRELRGLRQRIPDYGQMTASQARGMVRVASVSPELVNVGINALDADAQVAGGAGRTAEELRQEADDTGRWTAVEDELKAMLKGVSAANLRRRHRLGTCIFQIYNLVTQLVRDGNHDHLLSYLDAMKRLTRARNKKAKSAAAKEPD